MKYIHIVQFHLMSGGGVGSVLTDLCEAMAKVSDEVYIISLFRRDGIDFSEEKAWAAEKGIHVMLMQEKENDSSLTVIKNLHKTLKELSKNDECCLFLHLKMGVLMGILSTLCMKNVKRVEVYHSGYMKYKLQAFICKSFIDKHIAVSKESKRQLIEWFHVAPKKVKVVYNGVDIKYIRNNSSTERRNDSMIKILSVGRLTRQKGLLHSIEAFSILKDEGSLVDCTYTVVGRGELLEQAKLLSKGYVSFTGLIPREEVYKTISSNDVVFFPSVWEGNSIFLLEVLALGKPLIVSDIDSSREVLNFEPLDDCESCRMEYFGVVVRAEDTSSCKKALLQIVSHKQQLGQMALKVKALADNFSIENQASGYFRIAEELFRP